VLSHRQELESFEHDVGIYLASTRAVRPLVRGARARESPRTRSLICWHLAQERNLLAQIPVAQNLGART
jgi:hypothetical protein